MKVVWIIFLTVFTLSIGKAQKSIVKFNELTVEIAIRAVDRSDFEKIYMDSAAFDADLGENFTSNSIKINSADLKDVEIFQAIETSLTVMWEGPHCDLIKWKHHLSDWKKLSKNEDNLFPFINYIDSDKNKFPSVTMNEVYNAVMKNCDKRWAEHVKNSKSVHDYPCDVGVSSYYFKIEGTQKASGKKIRRIIKIRVPMGC